MAWYQEPTAEAKLKALLRQVVLSFPQASILSWQVSEGDHLLVIVPHNGSPEKTIHVQQSVLHDHRLDTREFASLLTRLDLYTLLQHHPSYDLNLLAPRGHARHVTTLFQVSPLWTCHSPTSLTH